MNNFLPSFVHWLSKSFVIFQVVEFECLYHVLEVIVLFYFKLLRRIKKTIAHKYKETLVLPFSNTKLPLMHDSSKDSIGHL